MLSQSSQTMTITALAFALLSACSGGDKAEKTAAQDDGASAATPTMASADEGFAPGQSLAFEWSANGFKQLPAQYKWMGTGKRDDVYQPNFSLSVPETDDILWSSACEAGGQVTSQLYFAPPKNMRGNSATFKFETDKSGRTLQYKAKYIPTGQFESFQIVQNANDPMFTEMKHGTWGYIQIGEGSDATKQRISLASAAKSLNAFLPACTAPKTLAVASATPSAVTYVCKDGRTAKATYLGNDTDTPVVRLEIGGEHYLLSQIVSGSGARYDNSQEKRADKRITWHNKGKGSLFIQSEWDDVDGNNETIGHCLES
jgi:membrane-bound inhibitor of C-type lysozyme